MTDPTLELARRLMACRSVTPDDAGCMDIIGQRLQAIGFTLEFIKRKGVSNLWARRGDAAPLFVFAGHTDVVPSGPLDQWSSPPFAPEIRDGMLYGRGAVDMKSSLAAAVTAVEAFLAAHPEPPGSLAFLLTSDEEGEATDGTVAVVEALEARGQRLDYCLIGEPTSLAMLGDTIKNGRRGSLSGVLTVNGLQSHIAYPERGRNPIHQAAPAIAELAACEWDRGNETFPPTTWQVSNIHGGTGAGNVVPGHVEIEFNFRFATASTPESLQQRLCAILDKHGLEYGIQWTLGAHPFLTGNGPLAAAAMAAIKAVCGIDSQLSTAGGTSDGRFIAAICEQLLEVGPVNASSHQIDEGIAVDALPKLSAIYQHILVQILLASHQTSTHRQP